MSIAYLSPENLHKNPAFSHLAVVSGNVKTIYIGGQNAVDSQGNILGKGDLKAQAEQMLSNFEACLAAAGAGFEDIVKWTIFMVEGQAIQPAFEVFQHVNEKRKSPPLVTMAYVSALANPDFLIEIEAVAVVEASHDSSDAGR